MKINCVGGVSSQEGYSGGEAKERSTEAGSCGEWGVQKGILVLAPSPTQCCAWC